MKDLSEDKKKGGSRTEKCVSSATENMSALIDDLIKKARKDFKQGGKPDIDAKFLKESVGALKELYELGSEYGNLGGCDDGILIRFERDVEQFVK